MRNSEYNANNALREAAQSRRHERRSSPRPRRLRDALAPGASAGIVVRLSGWIVFVTVLAQVGGR